MKEYEPIELLQHAAALRADAVQNRARRTAPN